MIGNAPCMHVDGEFCERCWPPKSKDTKNAISMFLHLSKVDGKVYVAIDAKASDLSDFGITPIAYNDLGTLIEKDFQAILSRKTLI